LFLFLDRLCQRKPFTKSREEGNSAFLEKRNFFCFQDSNISIP
jgi:hypothetical protein